MEGPSGWEFAFLAVCVFAARVMDSLAGGGGLITLPALLAFGVPAGVVLGTNKSIATPGTLVSVWRYAAKLDLRWKVAFPWIVFALAGSALGARIATKIDPIWIERFLLIALPLVAFAVFSSPRGGGKASEQARTSKEEKRLLLRGSGVAASVGTYDGFFGPGTGTFLALGLNRFCRLDLLHATGYSKILNAASNVAGLVTFALAGQVAWKVGLPMALCAMLGDWTGAHLGLKKGDALIRPALVGVLALLFAKLLYERLF